ncbi:hypothetical protein AN958_03671 [Leucoagaricus sp. SymC.cos]|nr:hypothetical protein AN958_03671 [Leucoagaricus sp. SymC.cos]
MKFTGSLVALFASLSGTLTTTNFASLTALNLIGNNGAYTCHTQAQVSKSSSFKSVQILRFDYNALMMASSATALAGLTVIAGIYFDMSDHSTVLLTHTMLSIAVGQFGASCYVSLTIGNEVSSNSFITLNHCHQHSHTHAFYDPNTLADQMGNFVIHTIVSMLRSTCSSGKQIIITESSWLLHSSSNRFAVASLGNEHSALLNLNCACQDDCSVLVYSFEYDDQLWKENDNERSFGIFGKFNLNGDVFAPC